LFALTVTRFYAWASTLPILFTTVQRTFPKVGGKTQTRSIPMQGAPAQYARAVNADAFRANLYMSADLAGVGRLLFE
jgi:hypothetical protein